MKLAILAIQVVRALVGKGESAVKKVKEEFGLLKFIAILSKASSVVNNSMLREQGNILFIEIVLLIANLSK